MEQDLSLAEGRISPATSAELKRRFFTAPILWGAFACAMGILVFVAFRARPQDVATIPFDLTVPFGLVAMAFGAGVLGLRRWNYSPRRFESLFGRQAQNNQSGLPQGVPAREALFLKLPEMFFVPFVLSVALNEVIVILGFVIANSSRDGYSIIPFAAAGLLLHLYNFPSLKKLIGAGLEAQQRILSGVKKFE